jgi:hypothetical protein
MSKYHTIKLTDKQLESYTAAVKCIDQISESPIFYNSVRTINPGLKATDLQIKRELIDPLTKSLSKISISNNSESNVKKRVTNFNKTGEVAGIIKSIMDEVSKNEDTTKYYHNDTNEITTTQLRLLIRRYIVLNKLTVSGGYKVDKVLVDELSESTITKMYDDKLISVIDDDYYFVPEKKFNSFVMRLCIGLCDKYKN